MRLNMFFLPLFDQDAGGSALDTGRSVSSERSTEILGCWLYTPVNTSEDLSFSLSGPGVPGRVFRTLLRLLILDHIVIGNYA